MRLVPCQGFGPEEQEDWSCHYGDGRIEEDQV